MNNMLIESPQVAETFGVIWVLTRKSHNFLDIELLESQEWEDGTIILEKKETLYNYRLAHIRDYLEKIKRDTLIVLCEWLTNARGNGQRHWVNMQNGNANFNANIFLYTEKLSNPWELQERISTAIANILSQYTDWEVTLHYPFHYTNSWAKIAWHLVQSIGVDSERDFLRIGIWVNTAPVSPRLPHNDHLSTRVFQWTHTINIMQPGWIDFAQIIQEWVTRHLTQSDDYHDMYLAKLQLKKGDYINIYRDTGSKDIEEDRRLLQNVEFLGITETWCIITAQGILPNGDYHIVAVR